MTRQETFKRRIRERMAKTGERYSAARRMLIEQAATRQKGRSRTWVSEPETSDAAVLEATEKSYDQWCDIIEAWDGDSTDHPAVAAHLQTDWGLGGWWAQTVTVGYERIVGLRLRHQQADGSFAVSRSQKVAVDADLLRNMLLDDDHRVDLFPDQVTELRSKPTAKTLRIAIGGGVAVFTITGTDTDRRTTVTVQHEKLPSPESVEEWRFYWTEWCAALDGTETDSGGTGQET